MLTCMPCSKQLGVGSLTQQDDDDDTANTPSTKQGIKALTSQVYPSESQIFALFEFLGSVCLAELIVGNSEMTISSSSNGYFSGTSICTRGCVWI